MSNGRPGAAKFRPKRKSPSPGVRRPSTENRWYRQAAHESRALWRLRPNVKRRRPYVARPCRRQHKHERKQRRGHRRWDNMFNMFNRLKLFDCCSLERRRDQLLTTSHSRINGPALSSTCNLNSISSEAEASAPSPVCHEDKSCDLEEDQPNAHSKVSKSGRRRAR